VTQDFYQCQDCDLKPETGGNIEAICKNCIETCHRGHRTKSLEIDCTTGFCDCGEFGCVKNRNTGPPCKRRGEIRTGCTYAVTGANVTHDTVYEWYTCYDCDLVRDDQSPALQVVCKVCAETCHQGHDLHLEEGYSKIPGGYCDCGAYGCVLTKEEIKVGCKSRGAPIENCTFKITGTEMHHGKLTQKWYQCHDCDFLPESGGTVEAICEHCAKVCHCGHDVELAPHVNPEYGFCDCGNFGCVVNDNSGPPKRGKVRKNCSYHTTGPEINHGKLTQDWFQCNDCDFKPQSGSTQEAICRHCIMSCHRGHNWSVAYNLNRESGFCDCGEYGCVGRK